MSTARKRYRKLNGAASNDGNAAQPPRLERGIIKKLHVRDFLCHENLEIPLNPGVNIITGRNGSGKSAVLAAIVLAFGGKATTMNRGKTLKEYIRTGASSCKVSITLSNAGADGFKSKSAEYGDEIIIERTVNRDGGGGYCVKNAKNEVVSRKRDVLVRIMDEFNIQMDNPVILLNQDVSRTFLQSYNPTDLFKFFMKATMFEQISRDINETAENQAEAEALLKQKKASFDHSMKEVKRLKSQLDRHNDLDKVRNNFALLNVEHAWLLVAEQEEEMRKLDAEVAKVDAQLNTNRQKQAEAKDSLAAANQRIEALCAEVERLRNSADDRKERRGAAKRKADQLKTTVGLHSTNARNLQLKMDDLKNEKQHLERRIRELRLELQSDRSTELNAKTEQRNQMQEDLAEGSRRKQMNENLISRISENVAALGEEIDQLNREKTQAATNIRHYEMQLRQLRAGRGDRLQKFGSFMPNLCAKIQDAVRRRQFKKPPVGPLGASISVLDEKWALAAEVALKSCLSTFVCDNWEDSKALEKLFESVIPRDAQRQRPSIIVSEFENGPYPNVKQIQCEHTTLLSVLKIEDHNVFNVLVDQAEIETVILTNMNSEKLNRYMRTQLPQYCKVAYNINGDQCYPDRFYAHRGDTRARILTSSVEEVISELEDKLAEANALQQQSSAQFDKVNKQRADLLKQKRDEDQSLRKLNGELAHLTRAIQRITAEIEEAQPSTVNITALEEEVVVFTTRSGEFEVKLTAEKELLDDAKRQLKEAATEYQQFEQFAQGIAEKSAALEAEIVENQEEIAKETNSLRTYDRFEAAADNRKRESASKQEAIEKELQDLTARALEKGVRPAVFSKRNAKEALKAAKSLQQQLDQTENQIGSKEEVSAKLAMAHAEAKGKGREMAQINQTNERIFALIEERRIGYKQMRQMHAIQMKLAFTSHLAKRNYDGKLKIVHKDQKIFISVNPTRTDAVSLSQASSSKKRVSSDGEELQDLDMVNRRKAVEMLLRFARGERANEQFIFLTPLDPSFIPKDDFIGLFRLQDPKRSIVGRNVNRKRTHDEDVEEEQDADDED